ncbi:fumarate hydratase C-terminal domain-containing protein [Chloroflexota bacterium]
MDTKRLAIPLLEREVRQLNVGDNVYLDGLIYTCRSLFQIRAVEQNILPPIDFKKMNVMFHMGGIMKRVASGWTVVSLLATSSIRFEKLGAPIINKLGIRAIIGKGTMGVDTMQAMKEVGCVHLSWGALIGNILARKVKRVVDVYNLDELGTLEATWVLEVENFGPFIVDIDAKGNNLFHRVNTQVNEKLEAAYKKYGIKDFIYT